MTSIEDYYYLAGPMTGLPQFNFPEFDRVAASLRSDGLNIISPAELDDSETRDAALSSPDGSPEDDSYLDLRSTTAVDRAYLNPARRVAALTGPAWLALMRRIAHYYTRTTLDDRLLALEQAHQHPDYEHLAGAT